MPANRCSEFKLSWLYKSKRILSIHSYVFGYGSIKIHVFEKNYNVHAFIFNRLLIKSTKYEVISVHYSTIKYTMKKTLNVRYEISCVWLLTYNIYPHVLPVVITVHYVFFIYYQIIAWRIFIVV